MEGVKKMEMVQKEKKLAAETKHKGREKEALEAFLGLLSIVHLS